MLDQYDIEQKDGAFLYKAKEGFSVSKQKTVKKPQYKERPQYPLIEKIEVEAKQNFNEILKQTSIEIVKFIKNIQ